MKKFLFQWLALSLVILSIAITGCSSSPPSPPEVKIPVGTEVTEAPTVKESTDAPEQVHAVKVSISKSNGISGVNTDFFKVIEEESFLRYIEKAITSAAKQPGIADMAEPDYDLEVVWSNGDRQGFHLWLGGKWQPSTIMDITDTHTIYIVPDWSTNQLIDLITAP